MSSFSALPPFFLSKSFSQDWSLFIQPSVEGTLCWIVTAFGQIVPLKDSYTKQTSRWSNRAQTDTFKKVVTVKTIVWHSF